MDPAVILAEVVEVLQVGKLAVDAAEDAAPFIEAAWNIAVNHKSLTAEQRADLLSKENAMRAILDAPE